MMQENASTFDLRRLLVQCRRYGPLGLAVGGLILAIAIVITLRQPPSYITTATVMIDPRTREVSGVEEVLSSLPRDSAVIDSQIELLRSREFLKRLAHRLKLDRNPEFVADPALLGDKAAALEVATDELSSRLGVARAGLTSVINISAEAAAPAQAADIANGAARLYLEEQTIAKSDAARQATELLDKRLATLRVQLQNVEAQVADYRARNGLMTAVGSNLTEQEISTLNSQLAQAEAVESEREARLATARQQMASATRGENVGEALNSDVIRDLRKQRTEVSRKLAELSGVYGPRHPELQRTGDQLADVDAQIKNEISRIISNLSAEAQVARRRTASVEASLSGAERRLAASNAAAVRLGELERNAAAIRELYQTFLARLKETSNEVGQEAPDARIITLAPMPAEPASPSLPLNLAIGSVLALLGGGATAVSAHFLRQRFGTAEEVEQQSGIRYLGSIPRLSRGECASPEKPGRLILMEPFSPFSESFRGLRSSLLSGGLSEPRTIAVTSSLPREGKSTVSACLAKSIAQGGRRVVAVDCDLRRSALASTAGMTPDACLSDVLLGRKTPDEAVQCDPESGAYFILEKRGVDATDALMDRSAVDQLLLDLKRSFDVVILDTAPVLAVAETRILCAAADDVLLLARWEWTPTPAVLHGLQLLEDAGATVTGVALTLVNLQRQVKLGYGDPNYYYRSVKNYYSLPAPGSER